MIKVDELEDKLDNLIRQSKEVEILSAQVKNIELHVLRALAIRRGLKLKAPQTYAPYYSAVYSDNDSTIRIIFKSKEYNIHTSYTLKGSYGVDEL